MADAKLTALTALTAVADADELYIVDKSDTTDGPAGTSKRITAANLLAAAPGAGDMLKVVYDSNNDGVVDLAEAAGVAASAPIGGITGIPAASGNDATKYLNGQGGWTVPAGSGGLPGGAQEGQVLAWVDGALAWAWLEDLPTGPPSGFDPADLSPFMWFKSDEGTFQTAGGSAAVADDDPIGQWQDVSGNLRHWLQASSGARPILKTSVTQNGRPLVGTNLSGPGQSMTLSYALSQPFTLALALRCAAADNGYVIDGNGDNQTLISVPNGTTFRAYAGTLLDKTVPSSTVFGILIVVFDGASSVVSWNGVEQAGAAGPNTNNGGFRLACIGGGSGQSFNGYFGEILGLPSALDATNRGLLLEYLQNEWGL